MKPAEQIALLEASVGLREQSRVAKSESVRRTMAALERRVSSVLEPVIRKRVAAELLGVSVQALDRWIKADRLPTQSLPSAPSRAGIGTDFLLDLAVDLRRSSARRPLGKAIDLTMERRARSLHVVDGHNLITAGHLIRAGRRSKGAA